MAGIIVDTVTDQSLFSVTVERTGTDELFRRCVRADGGRCVVGDEVLGVCRVASVTAGDLVPVDVHGIVLVEAGAAVALTEGSARVKVDADGRAVLAGANDTAFGVIFSAAAAAGDHVPVLLGRS